MKAVKAGVEMKEQVEGGGGISVLRGGDSLSAQNVDAKALSMKVRTIPPGGVIPAHVHVDFETMIYMLQGRVRHEYGEGCQLVVENSAGDFIYIGAGVPHEVFNVSETEPATAVIARSAADEEEQTIPYDRHAAVG